MTQVLSLATRHMDMAPVHSRMDIDEISRAASFETAYGALHTPPSPLGENIMRRPSTSINTPGGSHDVFEQLRLNASTTIMQDVGSRDFICLCTPTPKIPRPRNAFILYRQHHQSQVTADNPRLSNPEISKIIGERWKNEVADVKETWKRLAEEEKQRHQHQYPNYRYQPRRGTKSQNWAGPSTPDDQGRCQKCNGRLMTTPRTPATPFGYPAASILSTSESEIRPSLHRLDTDIPRRSSIELSPINRLPIPGKGPANRSPDEYEPTSPDLKRRKANGAGDYHLVSGRPDLYATAAPGERIRMVPEGLPVAQAKQYTGAPLPDLGSLPRSRSFPMPPPPRPPAPWSWNEQGGYSRRNSGFDESLRLPPLQTAISPPPSRVTGEDARASASFSSSPIQREPSRNFDDKRLEREIMSIPFKKKLGVLARVCRPVPPIRTDGPSTNTRGAFVAVEGPSPSLLCEVGMAVEEGLTKYDEINLRIWTSDGEEPYATQQPESATALPMINRMTRAEDSLESCFQSILAWQEKSKKIVHHITGGEKSRQGENHGMEIERVLAQTQEVIKGNTVPDEKRPASVEKIPVALVKEGFSLTLSDKFAYTKPIADMYAPVDHWQWMASLWRGTVCPDLVIYVKPSEEDEISTLGTVELSKHMGLIVVRIANGKDLDEATERRLTFEVMEWMREGSYRDAVPQGWRVE